MPLVCRWKSISQRVFSFPPSTSLSVESTEDFASYILVII
ncbi:hypothetical protein NT01EI_1842 [Edwardsiella ictaluri 93-146]|uniref:Uncharacterized protein n=1 Tax=Edwardsiella ictaluri (strain 93-146) TaxID=634503 RepID=C5BGU0_EDWI9|nr:hypothetical protein NT01EI_1842 [Edwardsiella ictaluri 93-146]